MEGLHLVTSIVSSSCGRMTANMEVAISIDDFRWYEKAGLRRDALSSQAIDALRGAGDKGDRQ